MVLLRSREVTPKSLAKDSTPSNDREPSDVRQLQAAPSVSPSASLPATTPRRSSRLASISPMADETTQTSGRKRKADLPRVSLISEVKAEEEEYPAAEGTGNEEIVMTDMTNQDQEIIGGKGLSFDATPPVKRTRRWSSEEKGKGKLGEAGVSDTAIGGKEISIQNALRNGEIRVSGTLIIDDGEGGRNPNLSSTGKEQDGLKEKLTLEKGKELESNIRFLESENNISVDSVENQIEVENVKRAAAGVSMNNLSGSSRMNQFKEAARKNAARFAHVVAEEHQQDEAAPGVDVNLHSAEDEEKVEDWPGPFSTAMKIMRDRSERMNLQSGKPSFDRPKSFAINWTPRENGGCNRSKTLVPSLRQLCLEGLAKNADAITSLEHVPDVYRHRLSQLLCDSRKMNAHFFQLLVRDSPSEVRIRDCSWLTEEEFTECIDGFDTSHLEVLQLDFCGRSLPDYALVSSLARSLSSLPVLTTVSLSGAYRLSDVGLRSLVSAAPGLQCLNLSQCSLIEATSIKILADSLGSTLKELYINDCQNIVAMDMLPALVRLQRLEVLSLGGIETVSDNFITCFCAERGDAMKELVLSDCVKLTDASLKVIATACPQLHSLNLANLRKLTDSALGYLANGCRYIQTLKLRRSDFSDEAVAAFIEVSGETLKDLSLNSVKQVSHNTALAVARRARDLESLDVSWCRNLVDESVGLIVDSCLSLKVLKIFGCDQLTDVLIGGHSNPVVEIIGKKMTSALANVRKGDDGDALHLPPHYKSALSSM